MSTCNLRAPIESCPLLISQSVFLAVHVLLIDRMSNVTPPDSAPVDETLAELQSSAEVGDLSRFRSALSQWHDDGALALQKVLSTAAKAGHADIVAYLLSNTNGHCKVTAPAVRYASSRKHWAVMQAFLDAGWDINAPLDGGNTCPALRCVFLPKVT